MNLKRLLNAKGLNFWVTGSGVGWNLLWAIILLFYTLRLLENNESAVGIAQVVLIAAAFLGCMLTGWFCGWMAADGRGPTYGLYTSLGAAIPLAVMLISSGVTGIMVVLVALAGGFNGGMLSLRR